MTTSGVLHLAERKPDGSGSNEMSMSGTKEDSSEQPRISNLKHVKRYLESARGI
jgi:hypothetical protein